MTEPAGQLDDDLGVTEISMYYPAVDSQLPAFERIATEVLPVLRREHA